MKPLSTINIVSPTVAPTTFNYIASLITIYRADTVISTVGVLLVYGEITETEIGVLLLT